MRLLVIFPVVRSLILWVISASLANIWKPQRWFSYYPTQLSTGIFAGILFYNPMKALIATTVSI